MKLFACRSNKEPSAPCRGKPSSSPESKAGRPEGQLVKQAVQTRAPCAASDPTLPAQHPLPPSAKRVEQPVEQPLPPTAQQVEQVDDRRLVVSAVQCASQVPSHASAPPSAQEQEQWPSITSSEISIGDAEEAPVGSVPPTKERPVTCPTDQAGNAGGVHTEEPNYSLSRSLSEIPEDLILWEPNSESPSAGEVEEQTFFQILADQVNDGISKMATSWFWGAEDDEDEDDADEVDEAVGSWLRKNAQFAGMNRILHLSPGRYRINGHEVDVHLQRDDSDDEFELVVSADHGTSSKFHDYVKATNPSAAKPKRRTPGPALAAIRELPVDASFTSGVYDDIDEETREMAWKRNQVLPDPSRGLSLVTPNTPLIEDACSGGTFGRVFHGRITELSVSSIPPRDVFVEEFSPVRAVKDATRKRLHLELRSLGAQLCKLSSFLAPCLGVTGALNLPKPPQPGALCFISDGQLLSGGSQRLRDVLSTVPSLSLRTRLQIALRMVEAVAALHAHGMCHGGLMARCVLVRWREDEARVDVSVTHAGTLAILGRVGVVQISERLSLGTEFARYLAPESWDAHAEPQAASDLWSLGLLTAECLGRGTPHEECDTMQKLSAKILPLRTGTPRSMKPFKELAGYPYLATLVSACLHVDPAGRPRAEDLANELQKAVDDDCGDVCGDRPKHSTSSSSLPGPVGPAVAPANLRHTATLVPDAPTSAPGMRPTSSSQKPQKAAVSAGYVG